MYKCSEPAGGRISMQHGEKNIFTIVGTESKEKCEALIAKIPQKCEMLKQEKLKRSAEIRRRNRRVKMKKNQLKKNSQQRRFKRRNY